MVKHGDVGVHPIDGQVRPDRLADVVDAGFEDLVRTHHTLGADTAEMPRSLSGSHRHEVGLQRRIILDDGAGRGTLEEGTGELVAACGRAFQHRRQRRPVGHVSAVRHQKLVDVAVDDVAAGRHLTVEAVLDRQRLPVVPDVVDHRFRKSPVDDVDPTSTPAATSGGVVLNHVASSRRSSPVVENNVVGPEDESQLQSRTASHLILSIS